jgi:hypothetical protein
MRELASMLPTCRLYYALRALNGLDIADDLPSTSLLMPTSQAIGECCETNF